MEGPLCTQGAPSTEFPLSETKRDVRAAPSYERSEDGMGSPPLIEWDQRIGRDELPLIGSVGGWDGVSL